MTILSQSQAVVSIVKSVLGESYDISTATKLSSDQRSRCLDMLIAGFGQEGISMSADAKSKYSEPKKLKAYCSGLLTNWLNKSPELNGNTKYQAKNPGSRSGSTELKQALALKAHFEANDQELPPELIAFIEAEQAKITKPKTEKALDLSALPEELRNLVG